VPLVSVESVDGGRLRLTQQRFLHHGVEDPAPGILWRIPIRLRYAVDGEVREQRLLLTEQSALIDLDTGGRPPDWIHANADEVGYYRWALEPRLLESLSRQARDQLSLRERVALVNHLTALLDAGLLRGDAYLAAIEPFAGDDDPAVVQAYLGALGRVEETFVVDDLRADFSTYVQRVLRPAVDRFGLRRVEGEIEDVSLLRPALLAWLGDTGNDAELRAFADSVAHAYMETGHAADPSLVGSSLALTAIDGDQALFDRYRSEFESAQVPADRARYLNALGSFRAPALIEQALAYVLEGPLRPNELADIPIALRSYPPNRRFTFAWLLDNHDQFSERMPPPRRLFLPRAAEGCSLERLERAREFFGQPEHQVPGTLRELARVEEAVMSCAELRRREGESVGAYLRSAVAADRE
jgi:aminopeptidase N